MSLVSQIVVNSNLELVWKAWTEADRLSEWFAPEVLVDLKEGGKYELYFDPSNNQSMSTAGCKIIRIEAPHTLVFEWKGPDPFAEVMNNPANLTQVELNLKALSDGTLVTIFHSGWTEAEPSQTAKSWHEQAWTQMLSSLKSKLEAGQGMLCCQ
ncbi:SRPBCC domain-containing protein [Paenibacillus sp. FSL R10-2734]|uniref:SRPBCC family protein n=1 Tax=Paenibacillus sp. FSL R10-2734 TaxID=2954691 RepID=UPI0030D72D06